jgi:Holliday junction resolvasome RuvABC endonuclease subunit|tara:strand:+ start:12397 stop:12975 length:579 start_codon:yes stop_codon:yes gene_type:complete
MILGLDISTSIVGVAIVNPETKELVVSEHIDLTKIDSVFSKAELVGAELWQINNNHAIKNLFIETALMKFIPGRSKADTIVKLAKFNGIISWMCYDTFGLNPVYLNVNTARSLYGLSFPRGTKGPQRKKMVIESVIEKEKTAFKYEMARGGKNYKKGTDDRADAIVIARAGEFLLRNENNEGFLSEKIVLVD